MVVGTVYRSLLISFYYRSMGLVTPLRWPCLKYFRNVIFICRHLFGISFLQVLKTKIAKAHFNRTVNTLSRVKYLLSSIGPFARLPEHRDQGIGAAAAVPGVSQSGEVRRPHLEGHRTTDGALQLIR